MIKTQSHIWTVCVRRATNEDLSVIIKKVAFQLHPSFNNLRRVIESPPFELTERGWVEHGPLSTKKPVMVESYDEIVFPNPCENHPSVIVPRVPATLNLALSNLNVEDGHEKKRGDTKDHPLRQWLTKFFEADEL
uniref:YEATS domain-containing protein n=1 Tax=Lactuca sativa TaxID=4236 RepID=A0A9R1WAY4_LACSA|nr:hypothetical protein LSAT_V11C200077930 [Lactuca sativa]